MGSTILRVYITLGREKQDLSRANSVWVLKEGQTVSYLVYFFNEIDDKVPLEI